MNKLSLSILAAISLSSASAISAPLNLEVYNPQDNGIFAVSSTLITGPTEAMLIDSQFSVKDGQKLVDMVRKSGKKLTAVLITSGDPDFYFGLEPVVKAFPDARIIATPAVVRHINQTKDSKLAYWGPQMKDGAPSSLTVPEATTETSFYVDGEKIEIHSPESYAAYVWVPSVKTVLGGTGVSWGIHVWTADTQTPEIRRAWLNTLSEMEAMHPERVIPGHYRGKAPPATQAVTFTSDYLKTFEKSLNEHKNSQGVINDMENHWPDLQEKSSLELSAKVNKGETKW